MNKNALIAVIVVVVLLVSGSIYFSLNQTQLTINGETPSSTVATTSPETPPATPPAVSEAGVPTVITENNTAASNSTVVVAGKVTPNGAQTSYWYEYGETTTLDNRTTAFKIGSGFTAISAPGYITGLRATTKYYYRLSAQNRFGTVNGTTYSFSTNNNPPPAGTVPTARSVAATDVARTTATLHGQINPNNSRTTFWFEYGADPDFGNVTEFRSLEATTLSDVSATLANLKPLTKYYFRLNAQNQYGTVIGAVLSFTTGGPVAPTEPKVTTDAAKNVAASSATLMGRINPNGADTTYWFEYNDASLVGAILGTVTATQSLDADTKTIVVSANVDSLARNTKYFFRLVGKNQYGMVLGDSVSFTTKK